MCDISLWLRGSFPASVLLQFLTFELVRDKIFEELPAAQESVFYALVVSHTGG